MTDPLHVHPRYKRTAKSPYKPLFRPLVPVKAGTSQKRAARTYRGNPYHVVKRLPTTYIGFHDASKYTAANLPAIRAKNGVGRPISTQPGK